MVVNPTISKILGKDLAGFKVVMMTEAFDVNDDGRKTKSIGYFKDRDSAKAFIGPRATNSHKRVEDVFVLTDGKVGLVVNNNENVTLIDDEAAMLEIRQKAVAKLTPEERKVLGLE